MIFDGFGSSETGAQGATLTTKGDAVAPAFKMDADTCVLDAALTRRLEPGRERRSAGWRAPATCRSATSTTPTKTQRTYPTVDGVRYAVPGDRAQVAADGIGASSSAATRCASTPAARRSSPRRSSRRSSTIRRCTTSSSPARRASAGASRSPPSSSSAPASAPPTTSCIATAAEHLARYKLPKAFVAVDQIVRSASGKPDYRWAKEMARAK